MQKVMEYNALPKPPEFLKLGFAASTGTFMGVHGIRNLQITTPGGLRIQKNGPLTVANGSRLSYNINIYNDGASALTNIPFTDTLPANFQYDSIGFSNAGTTGNTFTKGSTTMAQGVLKNNTLTLQPNSYAILTVYGKAKFTDSLALQLKNTAIAKAPSGFTDPDITNDTSRTTTFRIPIVKGTSKTICSGTSTDIALTTMANATLTWTATVTAGSATGATSGSAVANAAGQYTLPQTLTNTGTAPATVSYKITPSYIYTTNDGGQIVATGPDSTVIVTVNPFITNIPINSADVVVCNNVSATLTATSTVGNPVYKWYSNSGLTTLLATGPTYTTPKLTGSTSYYVTVQNAFTCENKPGTAKRVDVTISGTCGSDVPSGCSANGSLLIKNDFGGNNASDPNYSSTRLPNGTTTYTFASGAANFPPQTNQYSLTKNPNGNGFAQWYTNLTDHTGSGYMAVFNADLQPGTFFTDTLRNLCPGTQLFFSAWAISLFRNATGGINPNLTFALTNPVTGDTVSKFFAGDIINGDKVWRQYGMNFTVPAGLSSIALSIKNNAPGGTGNDVALDDITVYACTPPVTVTGLKSGGIYCQGENLNLVAAYTDDGTLGAGYVYQWFYSTSGDLTSWNSWTPVNGATTNTLSIPSAVGYYRVVVGNPANIAAQKFYCCAVSNAVQVTSVNPAPTVNNITGTAATCVGDSTQLSNTTAGGTWASANASIATVDNTGKVKGVGTGTVNITYTVAVAGACSTTVSLAVTVSPRAIVNQPVNINICNASAVAPIILSGSPAGVTFSWTGGTTIGMPDGTGTTIPSFTAINAGTTAIVANITVTPIANGCNGVAKVFTVTVDPSAATPTISLSRPVSELGYQKVVTLTANAAGATSYQWYKSGVLIPGATAATYTIPSYSHADTGTYTVAAYNSKGCQSNAQGSVTLPDVERFETWKLVTDANGDFKPQANEILTYTIYVKNTGTVPLTNVQIKDTIPGHTTYLSGGIHNVTDNTVSFTIPGIAPGATENEVFTVQIDPDITGVDTIYNQALVQTDTTSHLTGCAEDRTNGECPTTIPTQPNKAFITWKAVTDTDGDNKAAANEILTYTIHIKNIGSVSVDNVTVTDIVPAHTTFITGSAGNGNYNGGTNTVTYSWQNLKVAQDTTVSFQVRVDNNITGVPLISNQGTITGDTTTHSTGCSESEANGNCTTDIPTIGTKSFDTWKTVTAENPDGKAQPGERLIYTIHVKNTGSVNIANISITDTIPAYTSYVAGSAGNGVYNATDKTITYSWTNLKVGQDTTVRFAADVATDLTGADSISNHARVTGDTISHPTGCSEATAADSCNTSVPVDAAKNFIAWKTVSDSSNNGLADAGELITYTIHVKNTGNRSIDSVTIKDTIPSRTRFVDGSAGNGIYNTLDSSVSFLIRNLGVGIDTAVSFAVRLDSNITGVDTVRNRVFVTGDSVSHPTGCSEATASDSCNTDIPANKIKDFFTWKTVADSDGDGKASAGDTLTYTVHVKNTGNVDIFNLILSDTIPEYTTFIPGLLGGSHNSFRNTVNFVWSILRVGQDTSFSFRVKVDADLTGVDSIRNRGIISADTLTRYTACSEASAKDSCTTTIPVQKTKAFITWKSVRDASGNGRAEANELLTYSIHIKNTGSIILTGIVVQDTLPPYTTLVNGDGGIYNPANRAINFTITRLLTGRDTSVSFVVRVNNDLTGADTALFNQAVVTSDTVRHPTGCAEATAIDSCVTEIPLTRVKSFDTWKLLSDESGDLKATAGEKLTYTIHVKNTGNVAINNVTLVDTIPLHTTYLAGSGGIYNAVSNTVSFSWTNLKVAQDTTVTFIVTVNADITSVDTIHNQASVTGDTITHETGCSEATPNGACPTVMPTYQVKSFKTWKLVADASGDGLAQSGEVLTYTIFIKNTGNVLINNITIRDTMPAYTSFLSGNGLFDSASKSITFTGVHLGVGRDTSFTFTVRVADDLTGARIISNVARVNGDTLTYNTGCSEDKANGVCRTDIPVDAIKDFKTWKFVSDASGNGLPGADEILTYTIHVKNTGNVILNNTTVRDSIPAHTTYVANSGGIYDIATNTVIFRILNLGVHKDTSVQFQVKIDHDITAADTIRNKGVVTGDTVTHPTGCSESTANSNCETIIPTDTIYAFSAWKTVADADGDGFGQPGEDLTYSIHVRNTGNLALSNLLVYDTVPVRTTYVAGSGGVVNGNRVEFGGLNIAVGDSVLLQFKVHITENSTGRDTIANIAYVHVPNSGPDIPTCNRPDGCPPETGDTTFIPVAVQSYIAWKTVNGLSADGFASAGEQLVYRINVRNTGKVAVTGLQVFDTIPHLTSYVPGSGGTINGSRVEFNNITVPVGATSQFVFNVQVDSSVTNKDSIRNIAFTNNGNGNTPTCTNPDNCVGGDTTKIPVGPTQFTAWKIVADANNDGSAQPGEVLTYTIYVKNTGSVTIAGVQVFDTIPAYTTYAGGSSGILSGGKIFFNNITIPVGDSVSVSFNVTVGTNLPASVTSIRNIGYVHEPGTPDQPTCNNPAGCPSGDSTEIQVKPLSYIAWKTVADANGDGSVQANEQLTYSIHVKNTGNAVLNGLLIYDTIPMYTTYVAGSGGVLNGSRVEFSNINVAIGDSVTVQFKVTAAASLMNIPSIKNIAFVHDNGGGEDKPTCTAPDGCIGGDTTIIPTKVFNYIAWKTVDDASGDGSAQPGEVLTYTIHVRNTDVVPLSGLLIYDTIPVHTTYVTGSGGTLNGARVDFSNVNIPVGDSALLSFKVTVGTGLSADVLHISNIAFIHIPGDGGDKPTCNDPSGCINGDSTIIPVKRLSYIAWKTVTDANGDGSVQANEQLTYSIHVRNTGTAALTGLLIYDTIPAYTSYVTGSGGVLNGPRVEFSNINIAVGDSVTVQFKVTAAVDLMSVPAIKNIAFVHDNGGGEDKPTCTAPDGCVGGDTTAIPTKVFNYIAWKTVDDASGDGSAQPGEVLTYTIHVRNTDVVPLQNLLIYDTIPDHTTYVTGSGGTLNGARVDFSNVNIPVGDSALLSFKVTVGTGLSADVLHISNIAFIHIPGDGGDKPTCNDPSGCINGDSTIIPVKPLSFIAWKTVADANGNGSVQANEQLTYSIHVKNTGNAVLNGLLIYDTIPMFTTYVAGSGGVLNGSRVEFSNVNVAIGDSVTVQFKVTAAASLLNIPSIKNIAFVHDNGGGEDKPTCTAPDGCVGGDTMVIPITQPITYEAWKTVSDASGDGKAQPGEILTYTIHLTNMSATALTGLMVYDRLPAYTTYVAGSGGILNGGRVEFSNINVPANDSVLLSFKVTTDADLSNASSIRNIAFVRDQGGKDVPTCTAPVACPNGDTTIIPVGNSAYIAWKTVSDADNDGKAEPGETLTYIIHLHNTGNVALTGLLVYDAIPALTTYVQGSGGTLSNGRVEFSNVNVPVGDSALLSFKVNVGTNLGNAGVIKNIGYIHDNSEGPDKPTCSTPSGCTGGDSTAIPVLNLVDLKITKRATNTSTGVGNNIIGVNDPFYYQIAVTNNSAVTAHNVVVTDTLASVLTYRESSADKGTAAFKQASRVITWTIDSLAGSEQGNLIVTVSSQQSGIVANRVVVTSMEQDSNPLDNISSVVTDVLELKIPNVVTPNGDGHNDKFVIQGLELYPDNQLLIFNRWNNKIYEKKGYTNDWDGSTLNAGTYYYELKLKDRNNQWHSYKGYITLLKDKH
ncbi:gliding motility-associated C-terminal domain-containing protein [Danxiaibacter flavus]|uniref:Gliding motility-associated C-terminal domain-containing protein n=1 Tax=Danxiaibacter flavus TaxID=3049108 RepID=A0ABV3ZE88_9BACT|nr:gliding motility-associated C-terminal domain-containing protein [Chitinophagaceae bacterium DXS]